MESAGYLFDATRLVPLNGVIRIATGRDAADAAVCIIFENPELTRSTVTCMCEDSSFVPMTHDSLAERNAGLFFQQEREPFAELDDETGPKLAREVDFDEADVGAGQSTGWSGVDFGTLTNERHSQATICGHGARISRVGKVFSPIKIRPSSKSSTQTPPAFLYHELSQTAKLSSPGIV